MSLRYIVLVLTILSILLGLRFFFFHRDQPRFEDGQKLTFETTFLSEPKSVGNLSRQTVNYKNTQIFLTFARFPEFHYGDTVRIYGTLKRRVLDNKNVINTMYFPKIEAVEKDKNIVLAITTFIRQKVITLLQKTLPEPSSSLLLGITFGIKENMPESFMEDLRISGVLHVVAASGMNVTMIAGFLSSIFAFFLRRQIALLASIIGILFYALLAGLEPSIVRASIMGILVFTSQILGRQTLSVYGLFLAGFFMLFINPQALFDIGFQLSFLATLGLIYIRPLFERGEKAKKFIERSIIGEGIITTVSAQATTIPILLSNFGAYSLWSVLVNGLVLWIVPIVMVFGGIGAIIATVIEPLGQILVYFSLPFLLFFQILVSYFANLGGAVGVSKTPLPLIIGYYAILTSAVIFFYQIKKNARK